MSAYGHELEQDFSAQSLPSRGGSEMGSRYTTEAGIFMSSLAATVCISGLVTVGLSLLALLVALTVMLQSCESRNSGVIEMSINKHSYDYCRNFALYAEMNNLGAESLPVLCKDIDKLYMEEGQYKRDLNITVGMAEDFFDSIRQQYDGRGIVLIDADDLVSDSLSSYNSIYRIDEGPLSDSSRDADYLKHIFVKKLYLKVQSDGFSLILFSRKPEKLHNETAEYLFLVGCHGWSSILMRKEYEMQIGFQDFLSKQRTIMQKEGSRITAVISSQMDALIGSSLGERVFKLPSLMFRYGMEDHVKSQMQKRK